MFSALIIALTAINLQPYIKLILNILRSYVYWENIHKFYSFIAPWVWQFSALVRPLFLANWNCLCWRCGAFQLKKNTHTW